MNLKGGESKIYTNVCNFISGKRHKYVTVVSDEGRGLRTCRFGIARQLPFCITTFLN